MKDKSVMGRRKKYLTEEEKKAANNEKVKRFYWAHKEECDRKARERYHRKKLEIALPNNNGQTVDTPDEETEQVIDTPHEQ